MPGSLYAYVDADDAHHAPAWSCLGPLVLPRSSSAMSTTSSLPSQLGEQGLRGKDPHAAALADGEQMLAVTRG